MTQKEFAILVGVSKLTIALWETDKRCPSDYHAGKLEELKNGKE